MTKYNVGDKVKIVDERVFGFPTSGEMDKWLGRFMTIREAKE